MTLPPLGAALTHQLVRRAHVCRTLRNIHNHRTTGLARLRVVLIQIDRLTVRRPRVGRLSVGPLLIFRNSTHCPLITLSTHTILARPKRALPKPTVHPCPDRCIAAARLQSNSPIAIHPVHPRSRPLLIRFRRALSRRDVCFHCFRLVALARHVTRRHLAQVYFVSCSQRVTLIISCGSPRANSRGVLTINHLDGVRNARRTRFTVLIDSTRRHRNVNARILHRLLGVTRSRNLRDIATRVLQRGHPVRQIYRGLNFALGHGPSFIRTRVRLSRFVTGSISSP